MRAVCFSPDGTISVEDRPDPQPGAGEVLVAVRSAGLNAADLLQAKGFYPAPAGSPADILGMELAGEVTALGAGATRFCVGDRVMAVVGGGAQAELCVVHERCLMPVPDGVSWVAAGGFPEAALTAVDALFSQCHLAMGERLLVQGAAGGVGSIAVQLGSGAGASVVASVRSAERRAGVAALAPNIVAIDPAEVAAHGPYDVILELVGGPNLATDLASLAMGGRICVIGVGAGAKADINLLALMAVRGSIHASTLRARPLEGKAAVSRLVEQRAVPLLGDGRIRVPASATFDISEAPAAYAAFAAGTKLGKVVLTT